MDALFLILATLAAAAIYAATGIEHGIIYHYHGADKDGSVGRQIHPKLKWWNENVHRSGNIIHYGLSAVLALLILDDSLLAAALVAGAPYLLADPLRQHFINIGSDHYGDKPKWWTIPIGVVLMGAGAYFV